MTSFSPMLCVTGVLPGDDEAGWAYEVKWDGFRAVASLSQGRLVLKSRNGHDVTVSYPELADLPAAVGRDTVLDGELVALDGDGLPDFDALWRRGFCKATKAKFAARRKPVTLIAFDVLSIDGRDLLGVPYRARREHLVSLGLNGPFWQTPDHQVGDGAALFDAVRRQGLEGLVGERINSTYKPGQRPGSWRKIKNFQRAEFVVCGWFPSSPRHIGGLLVADRDDEGRLRFAGVVEFGFGSGDREIWVGHIARRAVESPPFTGRWAPGIAWCRPDTTVLVDFIPWPGGGPIRHAKVVALPSALMGGPA